MLQTPLASSVPYRGRSVDDLVRAHLKFKSLSFKGATPAHIGQVFMAHYGSLPVLITEASGEQLGCETLHRARWLDPATEDISDPDVFCYPRTPDKQQMGRANLPGVPVFYTCGSADSSIREAQQRAPGASDLFRSEWRYADHRKWHIAPMMRIGDGLGIPRKFQLSLETGLREYLMRNRHLTQEYAMKLYECVAELFLAKEYEVTSWISHQIMARSRVTEMIVYPSIRAGAGDLCHAFHTTPIDQGRVRLVRVLKLHCKGQGVPTVMAEGKFRGDKVVWRSGERK